MSFVIFRTQIDLLDPKVHGMAGAMRSGKFGTAEYLPPTFDGPGGKVRFSSCFFVKSLC